MKIITIGKDALSPELIEAFKKYASKPQKLKTKKQICRGWRYKYRTGFKRNWSEVNYIMSIPSNNPIIKRKNLKHLIKFGEV